MHSSIGSSRGAGGGCGCGTQICCASMGATIAEMSIKITTEGNSQWPLGGSDAVVVNKVVRFTSAGAGRTAAASLSQ